MPTAITEEEVMQVKTRSVHGVSEPCKYFNKQVELSSFEHRLWFWKLLGRGEDAHGYSCMERVTQVADYDNNTPIVSLVRP
eukprot:3916522-Amphidinium_carterae.1